ncbi:MAG: hypothetical protein ABW196_12410 [Solirubrobacterales bacterium]
MESSEGSPLRSLAEATGRDFPHLFAARERTAAGLVEKRASLESLRHSPEASIVLMGSWGRAEVTAGSDDDFMVLVHGGAGMEVEPTVDAVSGVLDHAPSDEGPFAAPVFSERLVHDIGLDRDDNKNLTRRMLFLLESVAVTGDDVYGTVREEVLSRYLDESVKAYRPPRFLLNDVVRYWRTICVDFAGKEREGPEKWGLRNGKLRTSRKVLFAGGLLPVLECARFDLAPMRAFLEEQLGTPPTDRIAQSFLKNEANDEGARTLGAYDDFVGRMNETDFRHDLQGVTRGNAGESAAFSDVSRIGMELEAGLLALLYETRTLPPVVRDYAIF